MSQAHLEVVSARTFPDAAGLCALVVISTAVLVRVSRHVGLVDDALDAPERKRHVRAVPLVGGIALALALGVWVIARGIDVLPSGPCAGLRFDPRAVLVASALAFSTGLLDDLLPRGLGPLSKVLGQSLSGVALGVGASLAGLESPFVTVALVAFLAVVAQNAANTFDNADGALCGVATAGFALGSPFAGATLGFLPWNLLRARGSDTPRAWLGDAGSHLLGILLLATPLCWSALLLPLLDLARVAWARWRAGVPIWRGDRRHLAHRLEQVGLGPVRVVLVLVAATVPFLLVGLFLGS